jgi:CYTH domain-containing protein
MAVRRPTTLQPTDVVEDAPSWIRSPGRGRYARPERERRFLVDQLPPGLEDERLIEDLYLDGLSLRLRRVSHDGRTTFKLTQKVRSSPSDPFAVSTTTVYLSEHEHDGLRHLPGARLVKRRRLRNEDGHVFAVDEFRGHLDGLLLAEVEVHDLDTPLTLPSWAGREVTHDDRFSGGALARADAATASSLLAEH